MITALTSEQEAELIEQLAELEHEQWMKWSEALANEIVAYLNWLPEDLAIELSERLARWHSMWVPYDMLTEKQKEQDRVWARKVVAKLTEFNIPVSITGAAQ